MGIALIPGVWASSSSTWPSAALARRRVRACGAKLGGLSTGANDGVLCEKCRTFAEGKQGTLAVTDPNRVADKPTFGTLLPAQYQWPNGCCVCGAPPTRGEKVADPHPEPGLRAGADRRQRGHRRCGDRSRRLHRRRGRGPWHCGTHSDGASIAAAGGNRVRIRFRSYPYLRAFCQQNAVPPA